MSELSGIGPEQLAAAAEKAPKRSTPIFEYKPYPDKPDAPKVRRLDQMADFQNWTDKRPVVIENANPGDLVHLKGKNVDMYFDVKGLGEAIELSSIDVRDIQQTPGRVIVENVPPESRDRVLAEVKASGNRKVINVDLTKAEGYDPNMPNNMYNFPSTEEISQAGYPSQVTDQEQKPM